MLQEKTPLKIVFAGTPEFAAASLKALIDSSNNENHQVIAVYSQPDRPAGRGQKLVASPVKQLALEHEIPVYQPLNFKLEEDRQVLANLDADIMVVAAYGLILPKTVLDTPKLGCINVHASLLPRWRGAAPIHRSLIEGDKETGITIMQMDVGLDTGDMLSKVSCDILDEDTSADLHDRLAPLGGSLLVETLRQIKEGKHQAEKQDDTLANYASKLTKQEGLIDWHTPAADLARKIRGLSPWPGSYLETEKGNIKIHQASLHNLEVNSSEPGTVIEINKDSVIVAAQEGSIALQMVQFPGGKRLAIRDALNGKFKTAFTVGSQIGG
ncbi:MAG: methionyl-tRNA formyltransferase [Marinomonas sp.]